ncbi:hypothetical protein CesoFtcFv8_027537 [Champsocephalus esox]|uniref:Uncharacterized protein n=2 Tax=Champsocephalus TaxID=52236 RepID=A0AAN8GTX7_CHAGU|nr:hypothetical protein CesoFtcFv8_027537 [Champsocephalus esox]KAK5891231.1 hypothetical protein CgunFtcFv8_018505 [Champsocephalus gunnari]
MCRVQEKMVKCRLEVNGAIGRGGSSAPTHRPAVLYGGSAECLTPDPYTSIPNSIYPQPVFAINTTHS